MNRRQRGLILIAVLIVAALLAAIAGLADRANGHRSRGRPHVLNGSWLRLDHARSVLGLPDPQPAVLVSY